MFVCLKNFARFPHNQHQSVSTDSTQRTGSTDFLKNVLVWAIMEAAVDCREAEAEMSESLRMRYPYYLILCYRASECRQQRSWGGRQPRGLNWHWEMCRHAWSQSNTQPWHRYAHVSRNVLICRAFRLFHLKQRSSYTVLYISLYWPPLTQQELRCEGGRGENERECRLGCTGVLLLINSLMGADRTCAAIK